MIAFSLFKFAHILGIVLLLGNITVTAVWKVFADRTSDAAIVAFGQRIMSRQWLAWGLIATVPLIAAPYFMIAKPG